MSIFTTELELQLHQIAVFLQEDIKRQLIDDGHTATGGLVDSIKATVSRGSDAFVIEGHMAKQGIFVISGRDKGAKGVPIDALVKWIEIKNFSQGITDTRGLAFAIQKSIKKKGIKPSDFIGKVFKENETLIEDRIHNAIDKALNVSLDNLITNAKKLS